MLRTLLLVFAGALMLTGVQVFYDPRSGERRYVSDSQRPPA